MSEISSLPCFGRHFPFILWTLATGYRANQDKAGMEFRRPETLAKDGEPCSFIPRTIHDREPSAQGKLSTN